MAFATADHPIWAIMSCENLQTMLSSVPVATKFPASAALNIRFAETDDDLHKAQVLRGHVFSKIISDKDQYLDQDIYDRHAEHVLVFERLASGDEVLVATCRLIDGTAAAQTGGFYSASEFNLPKVFQQARVLEMGRVCVSPAYRGRHAVDYLWHGIWRYVTSKGVRYLFGCASFVGTNPRSHDQAFRWLCDNATLPKRLEPSPIGPSNFFIIDMSSKAGAPPRAQNGFRMLPPLLKGYLRVGAKVSSVGYVDHAFNTCDVFVVLDTKAVSARYLKRFDPNSRSLAA